MILLLFLLSLASCTTHVDVSGVPKGIVLECSPDWSPAICSPHDAGVDGDE